MPPCKGCINKVADAVKGVANKIKSFLHFSVPDEGPLADFESWMPDFMQGLADGICYKDFPTTIKSKGLNGFSKTEPTPTPAPDVQESNVTVTVQIGKDSYKGTLKKV